jgi:glycosyltransferase involved in cell wall biosynthesis
MKILQSIPYFNPKFGGDVNVCTNLSKELAKRNHEVTIITTDFDFDPRYADVIRAGGVTVIPFHCVANIGVFLYSSSMKIWLEKYLKDFDIIHLHNYRSYQNVVIHKYAMKQGIPYIVQAHGSVLPFFEKQKLKKIYDFMWGNKILKDASKCIAVSKVEKDQYLKKGVLKNKIEIILNGIDVSEYETLPEPGKFRKRYGIAADEKIILFLGRLHKSKGLDFLIKGFSGVLDQYQNVKLVIVGTDNGFLDTLMKQTKELKIDENVLVTGYISKNEKLEAFVDADVLVYPGFIEIFGLVPLEAIMCGTPVIVADDCGCGEIIKEARCGYLVKYGDIDDLREKMLQTLNDNVQSNLFVRNGQKFVKDNLSWSHIVGDVERTYLECISPSNGVNYAL